MPISEEAKRRASIIRQIYDLKEKAGALSEREKNNRKEATLFSILVHDSVWRFMPFDLRVDATFDVAQFVRANTLTNFFEVIAKEMNENKHIPLELIMARHCLSLKKDHAKITKDIQNLRNRILAYLDNNCISPEDL